MVGSRVRGFLNKIDFAIRLGRNVMGTWGRVARIAAVTAVATLTLAGAPAGHVAHPKLMWETSYDGGPGHHDHAEHVVATHRAIYVAATTEDRDPSDFTLLRYSLRGELQWERHFGGTFDRTGRPSDLVVAGSGVIVTGLTRDETGASVTTLRYGPHGHLRWSRQRALDGFVSADNGSKLAVAGDGSIRVSVSSGGDFLVISYASGGAKRWERRIDVSDGHDDIATDVAVDSDGNAYVAGSAGDQFGGYTTAKLDVTGQVEWTVNVHGPIGNTLGPALVEIGPDEMPIISAVPESTCGVFQSLTWKLASDGAKQWEAAYPPDPCDSLVPVGMRVRADGSVVVFGTGGTTQLELATVSYDGTGQLEWARRFGSGNDMAGALAIDDAGRAYVTGERGVGMPDNDALTASYDRDGRLRWRSRTHGSSLAELPVGIAVLDDGTVTVTGDRFDPDRLEDVFTLRYRQP
jgi:hypothetical protein